jgi:HD superfamily phosphohydrolase YqeK
LTAALIIPDKYPDFAETELVDAIRYHSTARAHMTLSDKIIYLSDYIEDTRKFEDCIALREEFFSAEPEKMTADERMRHLNRVLLHSLEITITDLTAKGKTIEIGTLEAAKSLKTELENN